MNRTTEVKIRQGTKPETGPTISRDKRDHIKWASKGGTYTVCFRSQDSPFKEWRFVVPAGGETDSGAVREDAELRGYDYDVYKGEVDCSNPGAGAADPTIFVDP
jgi:hypothetical protein